jgi:hypothetical protein
MTVKPLEERTYINLPDLVAREKPGAQALLDLVERKKKIKEAEDEIKEQKAEINGALREYIEEKGVDGIYTEEGIIEIRESRTGGRWDKGTLQKILNEDEMKEAWTEGNVYDFVAMTTTLKQLKTVKRMLE